MRQVLFQNRINFAKTWSGLTRNGLIDVLTDGRNLANFTSPNRNFKRHSYNLSFLLDKEQIRLKMKLIKNIILIHTITQIIVQWNLFIRCMYYVDITQKLADDTTTLLLAAWIPCVRGRKP